MDDLLFESAAVCAERIRKRELSPVELTSVVLAHIDAVNPALRAFVSVDHESALAQARSAEADVMSGKSLGPLHGVPYSLKDNIDIRGMATTSGLFGLMNNVASADSPVAHLARAAGAICVGKTALPELGWTESTKSPVSGITRNPWDPSRTAGGSSGGAGGALAAGLAPLAIATDGGGSIRQPAAFNGVAGFKPSAGLVPIYPPSRFGPLGHFGPMARNVDDVALLLDVIAGVDPRVDGSLERGFAASCTGELAGVRIGYSPGINGRPADADVRMVVEDCLGALRDAGAIVERIDLEAEGLDETWDALYQGATTKVFDQLPPDAKVKLSAEFVDFLDRARSVTSEDGTKAEIQRHQIIRQVYQATRHLGLVVTPTTTTVAFSAEGAKGERDASGSDSFQLTKLWNLTGQPALSLPAGSTKSGLPVGIQIVAHLNNDGLALNAGKAIEKTSHHRRPDLEKLRVLAASRRGMGLQS